MQLRNLTLAALAVLLAASFAGCAADGGGDSSKEGSDYPRSVRSNFVTSCDSAPGATKGDCTKVVDCVEGKVSLDDFVKYEERAEDDKVPPADGPVYSKLIDCSVEVRIGDDPDAREPGHAYAKATRTQFMEGCTQGGEVPREACTTILECLEGKLSFEDYVNGEVRPASTEQTKALTKVVEGCAAEAAA